MPDRESPFHARPAPLGWHVISGEMLLDYLRRATNGEDADLLFAELWANSRRDPIKPGEGDAV